MKLTYYVLVIDTNRYSVNVNQFTNILEDFACIIATYQGGCCKALCEDQQNLKLYSSYNINNEFRYESVQIELEGNSPEQIQNMYQYLKDSGTIIVDKWNDRHL